MSPTQLAWLLLLAVVLMAGVLVSVWLKVRRVHIATFRLVADVADSKREVETLFAQIQAIASLERLLNLAKPLPPLRGWAGSPDFLLAVAQAALERKPQAVLECGSGASTLVIARCLELNGSGRVYSLEHSEEFAERTRALLARHGLSARATVLHAPLERGRSDNATWYRESALSEIAVPIDLFVVDGPPSSEGSLARAPAYERVRPRLNRAFLILVDDADRADEVAMVERWRALDPRLQVTRMPAERGLALLESNSQDA